jgi:hypothetical protein
MRGKTRTIRVRRRTRPCCRRDKSDSDQILASAVQRAGRAYPCARDDPGLCQLPSPHAARLMQLIVTTRVAASLTAVVHAKIVARFRSLPQPLHLNSSKRMEPAAVHQLL